MEEDDLARVPARTLIARGDLRDREESGWLQGFSHIERLFISLNPIPSFKSLIPFRKLPFSLRFVRENFNTPHPLIFYLVSSFPLLEDLTFNGFDCYSTSPGDGLSIDAPPATPLLTGTLDFHVRIGLVETPRRLLPNLLGVFTSGNSLCFAITREARKTGW